MGEWRGGVATFISDTEADESWNNGKVLSSKSDSSRAESTYELV